MGVRRPTPFWFQADLKPIRMPVLRLVFLRYAYSRFKLAEAEILKDCPMRGGRVLPVEASGFASRSNFFLFPSNP